MNMPAPWKIIHLRLDEPFHPLEVPPEVRAVPLVFWWEDLLLGQRSVPCVNFPLTATEVRELALQTITPVVHAYLRQETDPSAEGQDRDRLAATKQQHCSLQQLRDRLMTEEGDATQTVSVIVCTRERPETLARCLDSILRLDPPPHEILVVDNAPTSDRTWQLVSELPGIRYVTATEPGLSIARNVGIAHSTGDLLAFTDDDVVVHPAWLARLRQAFADPEIMAVTGQVLPGRLDTEAQVLFELHWGFGRGYYPIIFNQRYMKRHRRWGVPVWGIGAGANMAIRRRVVGLLGGFDERLGAGASGCSEDSEYWYRILANGWKCRYEPTAVVHHYHREDLEGLNSQLYYYVRGHVVALLIQYEKYRDRGNLRRLLITLPRYYADLFAEALETGFEGKYRTLRAELSGYFSGLKYYFHSRRSGNKALPQPVHPASARVAAAEPSMERSGIDV